jgi:squalene-hopene/tetraprenyl-beta-curcumene cyclase
MVDNRRLQLALEQARDDLMRERVSGHWVGELSTSALSTATAVSALAVVERALSNRSNGQPVSTGDSSTRRAILERGVRWLLAHQNEDGGWGDTDRSYSNVATTLLAQAAIHLAGRATNEVEALSRAQNYLHSRGGITALRARYGTDRTFAVPILTNAAIAGLVPWREVAPLPFEMACLPQSWYRFLQLPVVSYAIPALVAIGQARYVHLPPWDPLRRALRAAAVIPSLRVLARMQPHSGGYLEAVPLTSFVLMSLAATGRADHDVSRRALDFLMNSARPDGSWPIDTNLATWNTTLAIHALSHTGEWPEVECLDWLLDCQHRVRHPFTGAEPGGWGWSDLSGAVPDADDTPGALLSLAHFAGHPALDAARRDRLRRAAASGVDWLLRLQNSDGGWPTFCRGWGRLPFDRSGADLTAHALRALQAWQAHFHGPALAAARQRGFQYLQRAQRPDGSWVPLWFGNQDHPEEENPMYGTARVLMAYSTPSSQQDRAVRWLVSRQNPDGGWGGGPAVARLAGDGRVSTTEETAVAVEALSAWDNSPATRAAVERGLVWLLQAVETDRYRTPAPIGFYFAKLWYYEKLYPVIFTVSALGQAMRRRLPPFSREGSELGNSISAPTTR